MGRGSARPADDGEADDLSTGPDDASEGSGQRIDKWLWFARIAKSRSLAQKLVGEGCVRINRQKVAKASQAVKAGDVVTVVAAGRVRVLEVRAPGSRRGPASEAQGLYLDQTPAAAPGDHPAATGPRPTKRDRRRLERLKGA